MATTNDTKNAGEAVRFTAYFHDEGVALTPTAVRYRLECLDEGSTVLNWTLAENPASVMTITVGRPHTEMQDSARERERKRLTVLAEFGNDTEPEIETIEFDIINTGTLPTLS